MSRRLVEWMSQIAVGKRLWILVISGILALAFASQLPRLKVDTSPEALVSEIDGQQEAEELFEKHFGRSETQLLVLLQGADLLSQEALQYQFRVHEKLQALETVAHVDGITHAPLPSAPFDEQELAEKKKQAAEQALAAQASQGGSAESGAAFPSEEQLAQMPEAQRQVLLKKREQAESAALAEALKKAQAEGKVLSDDLLLAIVEGDEQDFPQGVDTLVQRLMSRGAAPRMSREALNPDEYKKLHEALVAATWLRPALLSNDFQASALVVHFEKSQVFDESTRMAALKEVRGLIAGEKAPSGISVAMGGSPVLGEAILKKLANDRLVLNPAMAILCLLVLAFTFRWWPAVVAPLLAVGIAALGVMGGMAALGQPLTILTNIIPPLLLIVGLSDSVHLLGRYREEVRTWRDRFVAGRSAAKAMLVACFLTSLTTAVGFGSLATAKTSELQRFGIAASVGVILAYFATVFFVPAFIAYFPVPASWIKQPEEEKHRPSFVERSIFVMTRYVLRHHRLVVLLSVVLTLGLGWGASQVTADARLMDAFEEKEEVATVTRTLEDKLAGIRPLEVLLTDKHGALLEPHVVQKLLQTTAWLQADDEILAVNSYVDPLREARASLTDAEQSRERAFSSKEQLAAYLEATKLGTESGKNPFLTDDGKAARMTIFFKDSGVRHTLKVVEELDERLAQLSESDKIEVTFLGEAYTGSMGREHVLRDLLSGLGLALVSIFVLLALLFRSLPLGLVAMPPNIIPLLATGAFMMARGIQLNLTTVITFSIGIGLAVDDTVHVVARFREERRRVSSVKVALLRAARGTGTAIFVTAVSLSLGFSVLMLSEFVSVRQFGELIAVTVINCLISALLIQPALLLLVTGRKKGSPRT